MMKHMPINQDILINLLGRNVAGKWRYALLALLVGGLLTTPAMAEKELCSLSFYLKNYHHFDKDKDLLLSLQETRVLRCQTISRSQFEEHDENDDDKLSYHEWKNLLTHLNEKARNVEQSDPYTFKDKAGSV